MSLDYSKYKTPVRPRNNFKLSVSMESRLQYLANGKSAYRETAQAMLDIAEEQKVKTNKAHADWQEEKNQIEDLFKADALEETGLTGHPKAEMAFKKAWDLGHSNGLQEVVYELEDIAELMV